MFLLSREGPNKKVYFPLRDLERVYIEGAIDKFIKILCRQNTTLQSFKLQSSQSDSCLYETLGDFNRHRTAINSG